MRNQLQKFTDFTNTLLPHETEYLLSVQQFKDPQRLSILEQIDFNAHHIGQFTPYDTSIDKRKYSHLQNWIKSRLKTVDVDEQFNWMLELEQKIMTDTIQLKEEKALLRAIRNYEHPAFFFVKFYELVEHYRHFLLIRLRYADHRLADQFLQDYASSYLAARKVYQKLHDATLDIVGQYSGKAAESKQYEKWLDKIFFKNDLEGHVRYLALVRLTFISHNYRQYDQLREKFDFLDKEFSQGKYYSKRLLINYYSNRLMLHSHYKEYDQAVYYGYLSIQAKTHDYLFYVNNLCAVLLRLKRNQEALQMMKKASTEAKKTKNFHNRVGYVAFYMQALLKNGLYKNAEGYGDTFLRAFFKEVLQYRWHLFFSVYLETLLHVGQYEKLTRVAQKYRLSEKDASYRTKAGYLPVIPVYLVVARYKEGKINRRELDELIQTHIQPNGSGSERNKALGYWLEEVQSWMPELALQDKAGRTQGAGHN